MSIDLIAHIEEFGLDPLKTIDGIYLALKNDLRKADITTIIPAKGRSQQLRSTIEHLVDAKKKTSLNVGIIVVELSPSIEHLHVCREFEISYVWVHQLPDVRFNKCLAHNIGYCLSKSDVLHFHDSDLIMESNFYELFKNYSINKNTALHCMPQKYVRYMTEEESSIILEGKKISDLLKTHTPTIPEPMQRNAPGGSIAIGRNLFELIGGYDSHLFSGYSAEDQFFWDKIANIVTIPSMNDTDLFHIHHEADRTHLNNKHVEVIDAFRDFSPKGAYYSLTKDLLFKLKEKLHELQGL